MVIVNTVTWVATLVRGLDSGAHLDSKVLNTAIL